MEMTGLIAAYVNASPRVRYQLEEVARIVKDLHDRDSGKVSDNEPEFQPVRVRDLTGSRVQPQRWSIRDRLTEGQIERLVASCRACGTVAEAARTYGISPSSVSRLVRKAARTSDAGSGDRRDRPDR